MYRILETAERGRGLYATRDIDVGETIMTCKPYVHCLSDISRKRQNRCDYCTNRVEKSSDLKKCSACKQQFYCQVKCQKLAWTSGEHKSECKDFKIRGFPEETTLLFSRLLRRLERQNGDSDTCFVAEGDEIAVTELESIYEKLSTTEQAEMGAFLARLKTSRILAIPKCVRSARKLLDLCAQLKNNQFAICDDVQDSTVGSALYLNASLINHSCRPNAFPTFDGITLHIKCLTKITNGQEICISYIDTKSTTEERQNSLSRVYKFKCTCKNCGDKDLDVKKLSKEDGRSTSVEEMASLFERISEFRKQDQHYETLTIVDEQLSANNFSSTNIFKTRLLEHGFDASIETGAWDKAVIYGLNAVPPYELYYGKDHPYLGLHLMKLGKIMLQINHPNARSIITRAIAILSKFYPKSNKLLKELNFLAS